MKKASFLASAGALAMVLASGQAVADTYSLINFLGPNHATTRGQQVFADKVEAATDGRITFEVFPGGSLVPAAASLSGIRDGMATGGYVAGTYTPSDLPLTNTIADLGWLNPDPLLMAIASTDYNINNPDLQDEWARHNVVFLAGYASNPYRLMCREEVVTLDDISGKKIRMPGGAWDRVATALGATSVNVPSSEMYTGLERGSIDCAVNGADALSSFSLWDVTDTLNMIAFGTYFSGVNVSVNSSFWNDLSEEDRQILIDESARALVMTQHFYDEDEHSTLAEAEEKPTKIVEPSEDLSEAVHEFAQADINTIRTNAQERLGVDDPDTYIDGFNEVVAKWESLLADVDRTDTDAVLALVKEEIYSKISPETYGTR
ncbi:C4-dicarboxylate TRAP transporter substrate-binding protein [Aquibaculum sediminis]|uniref:C4-dicarboxylate TRAP transporter substrate-binding protein n=1 Tax=Aquibaculum sediminis TaxID=3231907 RepID=UPI003453433C